MRLRVDDRKIHWIEEIEHDTDDFFYQQHEYVFERCGDSLERQSLKSAWNNLWPDLEGGKDFNDDYREEITDFVQSILGFHECDEEDVETWMVCDAEDCEFQMLNDDKIVTSVQE
ncbi:uncharacterized protein TNCV_245451 [Trichonephila clavipes]|nr:uncharacterized protein TNCV_245451 [Trichonephila clavipes]